MAWTTTDIRLKPSVLSKPEELHIDDDTTPDEQVQSSSDEEISYDHIPMVNLRQHWWKPLTKDIPATPEPAWSIPSSDLPVPENKWASALASTYAPPPENSLLTQTGDMDILMGIGVFFLRNARDHSRRKKKKRRDSPKTPHGSPPHQLPPPPPLAGSSETPGASGSSQLPPPPPPLPPSIHQSDQSTSIAAPSSSKTAASAEYTTWMTTDTRLKPSVLSIPEELHMNDDTTPDEQVQSSGDEEISHDHIPTVNLRQNWWKPLTEDRPATLELAWSIPLSDMPILTGDMAIFMEWFCKKQGITELKQQDLEVPTYEIVKFFHPNVIHLQYQMEECHKLLTDQVDESILRLGVSMIRSQEWQVYIVHLEDEGSLAVKTHMRILSVVRIEVFSLYGYDYMKKIVLRRADLKEYTIAERDFKYLYPSDFEDLYLLNLQGHLNHLPPKDKKILTTAVNLWTRNLVIRQRVEDFQLGIESYQTQLNLTKPRWDATGFEFKHDFTVIDSPRAVTFRDKYGVQMIMRFNEIHKFSDGTLQQIDEALDYRVKEFKVNRMNPGLNTRFWTRKDVDRSKEFMFAIQKWLKTRRIF
ncbi:hypothetical protein Tco_1214799 [Tanacetum coccineum]